MANEDYDGVDPFGIRSTDRSIIVQGSGVVDIRVNPSSAVNAPGMAFGEISLITTTSSAAYVTLLSLPFTKGFAGPMLFRFDGSVTIQNEAINQNPPAVTVRLLLDGVPLSGVCNVTWSDGGGTLTLAIAGALTLQDLVNNVAAGPHILLAEWKVLTANMTATIDPSNEVGGFSVTAMEVRALA